MKCLYEEHILNAFQCKVKLNTFLRTWLTTSKSYCTSTSRTSDTRYYEANNYILMQINAQLNTSGKTFSYRQLSYEKALLSQAIVLKKTL